MVLRGIAAVFFTILVPWSTANAQHTETENIILVTLDGLRWQEVFEGADHSIIDDGKYVSESMDIEKYSGSADESREALMPFLWNVVGSKGQLYGNRHHGNKVNCTNHHLLSFPGYSEMLVGFRHPRVSSNRKVNNPHATVFETIGSHPHFRNEIAAFATWDAFPYILRESQSDIYVNAGNDIAHGRLSNHEKRLNDLMANGQQRSDSMTFQYAMEYMKRERPRVTFIGFDATDYYAHRGQYDSYLHAAQAADRMIAQLWQWVQSQPDYRDKTTLFITTDHGRGNGKNSWRKHRLLARGSRHIWFAVIGPDTPAFGEMKIKSKSYQNQVAKTLAAFLGMHYENEQPVGDVLQTMISVPQGSDQASTLVRGDEAVDP